MRIEIYVNGKHLASESPEKAVANYMAFMAARYHPGIVEFMGSAPSFAAMMSEYFNAWFDDMINRHELHVVDMDGNPIYDQYLVTEENHNDC